MEVMTLARKSLLFVVNVLIVCILVSCSGIGNAVQWQDKKSVYRNRYKQPSTSSFLADVEEQNGYKKVGETSLLKLFYNEEEDVIEVHNKQTGYVWSSIADWEGYHYDAPSPMQKAITGSLFAIVYSDVGSNEGKLNTVYSNNEPSMRSYSYIQNGISLKYNFSLLSMTITLNISIEDDQLVLAFPSDGITENSRYLLMSLQLLPSFGASNHEDEGYIFYPDGSGALLRYENYNNRPSNPTNMILGVYGNYRNDISDYFASTGVTDDYVSAPAPYDAAFPLFGVKKGNQAFLAYVSMGDAQSKIQICPEGYTVNFNRAFFEFQYRNTFEVVASNISAGNSSNKNTALKVDKTRMDQDYVVNYRFLSEEDSDYSGMARVYRKYLQDNAMLKDSCPSPVPLALDLFCGDTEERIRNDKLICHTTFEQAKIICNQLLEAGVSSQSITLKGWTKKGYGTFPVSSSAASQLGGKHGLDALAEYTTENNLQLFAQINPLLAISGNSGFSIRTNAVYCGNSLPFSDKTNTYYLLSPMTVGKKVVETSSYLQTIGNIGLSLDGIARYVYDDYSEKSFSMRTNTAATWQEVMSCLSGVISVENGNQYALAYADRLYNVPTSSSRTSLADEDVPFWQMVVHGSIPYSSNAGNLFYDESIQKLKWIEYGCMPYFELTYEKSYSLKYTDYNRLYSSYYEDWLDNAVSIYREFNTSLAGIWSCTINQHVRLADDVVKLVYENDVVIYINYSDIAVTAENHEIPARNYLVIG